MAGVPNPTKPGPVFLLNTTAKPCGRLDLVKTSIDV